MKNLINPNSNNKGFIYQIVSNSVNGIDVDKFDYMTRDTYMLGLTFNFDCSVLINDVTVINNNICFPEQMYYEVMSIYTTRYRLHKQIYSHKTVIAIKFMMNEIIILLDPVANIYHSIKNVKSLCDLTDDYIFSLVKILYNTINFYPIEGSRNKPTYPTKFHNNIKKAYNIWQNINKRIIYKHIGNIISKTPLNIVYKNIFDIDPSINENDILIHNIKMGYISGKIDNPMANIYFYKLKMKTKCFKINKRDMSKLIPDVYHEYVCMIYSKDKTNKQLTKKISDVYQKLKMKCK